MLHHRLGQERVNQVGRARPQAVAPEQLAVRQTQDLTALAGRKVVRIGEPGMAAKVGAGRRRRPKRQGREGPGRMAGPAPHLGPVPRIEPAHPLPAAPVDHHLGVGRLEEDGVAPLPRDQAGRPRPCQPPGDVRVIGRVDAVQRRPEPAAERRQQARRDGRHGLSRDRQRQPRRPGDRPGVGPFVALRPFAVIVDERGAGAAPGRGEAAGHDGRVQTARDLAEQDRVPFRA